MSEYKPRFVRNEAQDEDMLTALPAYSPDQLRCAYNFPPGFDGNGNTIAVVVAFGSPSIEADLQVFNERFNLPDADLTIAYPQGQPVMVDPDWQLETSLDVQWAHALAPKARILLVVALDNSAENLFGAVQYAVDAKATIVTMSWGGEEFPEEIELESVFRDQDVIFFAASGDQTGPIYPSTSQYVIAAGGTSLLVDQCGKRQGPEIPWYLSGGGISQFIQKPGYQFIENCATPKTDMRTTPDVAFFGDVFPGVPVYVTVDDQGQWVTVGGTSVSSPCLAAIMATALPPGARLDNTPALLYEIAGGCRYTNSYKVYCDVKFGNTMSFPALKGFDYASGLGSFNVARLVKFMAEYFGCKPCSCCKQMKC